MDETCHFEGKLAVKFTVKSLNEGPWDKLQIDDDLWVFSTD